MTIPLTLDNAVDKSRLKVFYYDTTSNTYKLAGDGGKFSSDGKSITVEIDHFTTFAVFEIDETKLISNINIITPSDDNENNISTNTTFLDVPINEWFTPFVNKLVNWDAVSGYSDNTYRPGNNINRAEIAKIVTKIFNLDIPEEVTENPFPDVPKNTWFAPYVLAVKNAGIINGYANGNYGPRNFVTRSEAMKISLLSKYSESEIQGNNNPFSDIPNGSWYEKYVLFGVSKNVVNGYSDGTFRAEENLSRGAMAKIVVNIREL